MRTAYIKNLTLRVIMSDNNSLGYAGTSPCSSGSKKGPNSYKTDKKRAKHARTFGEALGSLARKQSPTRQKNYRHSDPTSPNKRLEQQQISERLKRNLPPKSPKSPLPQLKSHRKSLRESSAGSSSSAQSKTSSKNSKIPIPQSKSSRKNYVESAGTSAANNITKSTPGSIVYQSRSLSPRSSRRSSFEASTASACGSTRNGGQANVYKHKMQESRTSHHSTYSNYLDEFNEAINRIQSPSRDSSSASKPMPSCSSQKDSTIREMQKSSNPYRSENAISNLQKMEQNTQKCLDNLKATIASCSGGSSKGPISQKTPNPYKRDSTFRESSVEAQRQLSGVQTFKGWMSQPSDVTFKASERPTPQNDAIKENLSRYDSGQWPDLSNRGRMPFQIGRQYANISSQILTPMSFQKEWSILSHRSLSPPRNKQLGRFDRSQSPVYKSRQWGSSSAASVSKPDIDTQFNKVQRNLLPLFSRKQSTESGIRNLSSKSKQEQANGPSVTNLLPLRRHESSANAPEFSAQETGQVTDENFSTPGTEQAPATVEQISTVDNGQLTSAAEKLPSLGNGQSTKQETEKVSTDENGQSNDAEVTMLLNLDRGQSTDGAAGKTATIESGQSKDITAGNVPSIGSIGQSTNATAAGSFAMPGSGHPTDAAIDHITRTGFGQSTDAGNRKLHTLEDARASRQENRLVSVFENLKPTDTSYPSFPKTVSRQLPDAAPTRFSMLGGDHSTGPAKAAFATPRKRPLTVATTGNKFSMLGSGNSKYKPTGLFLTNNRLRPSTDTTIKSLSPLGKRDHSTDSNARKLSPLTRGKIEPDTDIKEQFGTVGPSMNIGQFLRQQPSLTGRKAQSPNTTTRILSPLGKGGQLTDMTAGSSAKEHPPNAPSRPLSLFGGGQLTDMTVDTSAKEQSLNTPTKQLSRLGGGGHLTDMNADTSPKEKSPNAPTRRFSLLGGGGQLNDMNVGRSGNGELPKVPAKRLSLVGGGGQLTSTAPGTSENGQLPNAPTKRLSLLGGEGQLTDITTGTSTKQQSPNDPNRRLSLLGETGELNDVASGKPRKGKGSDIPSKRLVPLLGGEGKLVDMTTGTSRNMHSPDVPTRRLSPIGEEGKLADVIARKTSPVSKGGGWAGALRDSFSPFHMDDKTTNLPKTNLDERDEMYSDFVRQGRSLLRKARQWANPSKLSTPLPVKEGLRTSAVNRAKQWANAKSPSTGLEGRLTEKSNKARQWTNLSNVSTPSPVKEGLWADLEKKTSPLQDRVKPWSTTINRDDSHSIDDEVPRILNKSISPTNQKETQDLSDHHPQHDPPSVVDEKWWEKLGPYAKRWADKYFDQNNQLASKEIKRDTVQSHELPRRPSYTKQFLQERKNPMWPPGSVVIPQSGNKPDDTKAQPTKTGKHSMITAAVEAILKDPRPGNKFEVHFGNKHLISAAIEAILKQSPIPSSSPSTSRRSYSPLVLEHMLVHNKRTTDPATSQASSSYNNSDEYMLHNKRTTDLVTSQASSSYKSSDVKASAFKAEPLKIGTTNIFPSTLVASNITANNIHMPEKSEEISRHNEETATVLNEKIQSILHEPQNSGDGDLQNKQAESSVSTSAWSKKQEADKANTFGHSYERTETMTSEILQSMVSSSKLGQAGPEKDEADTRLSGIFRSMFENSSNASNNGQHKEQTNGMLMSFLKKAKMAGSAGRTNNHLQSSASQMMWAMMPYLLKFNSAAEPGQTAQTSEQFQYQLMMVVSLILAKQFSSDDDAAKLMSVPFGFD